MLVSTLPRDLVVAIIIDGTFAHFVRQMLTGWEREVFWDKLTIEIRQRQESGALPAANMEAVAEVESSAEDKAESGADAKGV